MKGKASGIAAGLNEAYEGQVVVEAIARAGKNKNLHGIVHEIIVRDNINSNPVNVIKGVKAVLSKSPTAVRDDILVMKAGRVIKRYQLKDTTKSISKTFKQVSSGKYRGTTLIGTNETTEAFNIRAQGTAVTQRMHSSGVSTTKTTRIAGKALGNLSGKAVWNATKTAAIPGAIISGGLEALTAGQQLYNGEISKKEFAGRVVKETVGGGVSAGAGGAAATVAATIAAGVLAETTAPVWVPVAIGVGTAILVGTTVKKVWDSIWD